MYICSQRKKCELFKTMTDCDIMHLKNEDVYLNCELKEVFVKNGDC